MLKNKMKKLICGMTMCITVCSQMIFPQTAFAATKAAVEKAGEAFVAGMTETAEAEKVLSEEELRQQIVDFALQFEGNPYGIAIGTLGKVTVERSHDRIGPKRIITCGRF